MTDASEQGAPLFDPRAQVASLLDPPPLFKTRAADRLWAFLVPHLGAMDAGFVSAAIEAIESEATKPLIDAYEAMDAACRWAAGTTAGIKTIADAERHSGGYDALLDATVKAGQAAGLLR